MRSNVEIRGVKEKEKERVSVCSGDIVLFRVVYRDKITTKALGRVNRRLSNSIEIATIGGATIHKIEDKDDIYVGVEYETTGRSQLYIEGICDIAIEIIDIKR